MRHSLAVQISGGIFDDFIAAKPELSAVCEPGKECRDAIYAEAKIELEAEWMTQLTRVFDKMHAAWLNQRTVLEESYRHQVIECSSGDLCPCVEIDATYTTHVRLQRELERQITELQTDLETLKKTRCGYLNDCMEEFGTPEIIEECEANSYYQL